MVASAETVIMLMYSARKNSANLQRGVLGVEAADQLALGLGQVERRPVGLADHGDAVDRRTAAPRPASAGCRTSGRRCLLRSTIAEVDSVPGVEEHRDEATAPSRPRRRSSAPPSAARRAAGRSSRTPSRRARCRRRRSSAKARTHSTATGRSVSCSGVWWPKIETSAAERDDREGRNAGIAAMIGASDVDATCHAASG